MLEPETRILNQSTYTPIKDPVDDQRVAQPFVMQGILGTLFDDCEMSKIVLTKMAELKPSEILPDPPQIYGNLISAVEAIWKGDITTSITILRELRTEQVARFARKALEVERLALASAQQDLCEVISSVTRQKETEAGILSGLQNELAEMRKSMMTEIRGMIDSRGVGNHHLSDESPIFERAKVVATPQVTDHATSSAQPDNLLGKPEITADLIRAEMIKVKPQTVKFLENIGLFSSTSVLTAAMVPAQMLSVRQERVGVKAQTVESLLKNMKVEPVGFLHLERLQFTPLGYVKGELVYSLPMLPGETVRLTHREWSRTETEFTKLVQTEMEQATKEALSENSELTQSTSTQQQHNSAFNTSVNASGGFGSFNISTSVGYSTSSTETSSRLFAAKRAMSITKEATSRAKKDSKITFKVATAYELEDQQYREISNTLKCAVRYDFHRLMKKWRIDLYRYDIRLTYDIVIPEPGSYLLRKYLLLKALEEELAKPFEFSVTPLNISRDRNPNNPNSWIALGKKYEAYLEAPLEEPLRLSFTKQHDYAGEPSDATDFIELILPEGYYFESCVADGSHVDKGEINVGIVNPDEGFNHPRLDAGAKFGRSFAWRYYYGWNGDPKPNVTDKLSILVDVIAKLTDDYICKWQMDCYNNLLEAAKRQYENKQLRLKQLLDDLKKELDNEDALILRKTEREELMKGVLRWLLGPKFKFYPQDQANLKLPNLPLPTIDMSTLDPSSLEDIAIQYYDPATQSLKQEYWGSALQYGELIKFLHQAIEWENINYLLYPYFWSFPDKKRWDFKQSLFHADYIHRNFLRAGAARVILTIRPGYEQDFLSLMLGHFGELLPANHRYMTIAEELKSVATANYPYTQDANTEKEEYIFSWEKIQADGGAAVANNENDRLRYFLKNSYYVDWAEQADAQGNPVTRITKPDQNTIRLSVDYDPPPPQRPTDPKKPNIQGSVELKLVKEIKVDNENNVESKNKVDVVVLQISGAKKYQLAVKQANNLHKVYREQNLIDTWFEFTPTGALDVEIGKVSAVTRAPAPQPLEE